MNKIIIAITGASGSVYAKTLLDNLQIIPSQYNTVAVVMSDNAKQVWEHELGNKSYENYPFAFYEKMDFNAPFASGSARYNIMVVCPCSMGTMARIATGVSNALHAGNGAAGRLQSADGFRYCLRRQDGQCAAAV